MNAFRSQYPAAWIKILKPLFTLLNSYIVHPYTKAELFVLGLSKDLRVKLLYIFFWLIVVKVLSLDNETTLIL